MTLKYYDAYRKGSYSKKPKDSYINDFSAMMAHSFDNAANIFYNEIEFELNYGSNEFIMIPEIRVDSVTDYNTSMLVNSDEYKIFIFKPDFPTPTYGMKFRWGEDYWLVINTDNTKNMAVSCEVRRCNNVLRFFDENGNKIYEPCIMDTTLRFTNNIDTPPITTGKEEQKIWCQRNSRTTTIKPNDKFLFGAPNQRYAIRLYAGGMKNELNTHTMDDTSPTLTEFYFQHYQINPEYDDLENGFANAYMHNFSISIDNIISDLAVGTSGSLSATVMKNGKVIDKPVIWKSSDETILEISEVGEYISLAEGEVTVTVSMEDNDSVFENMVVKISNEPVEDDYSIDISPDQYYILQGNQLEYSCYLYKNGIKQNDEFEFIDYSSNVPRENYSINVIDGNHFIVKNYKMFVNYPIIVRCKDGEHVKDVEIKLRGLF